MVAVKGKVVRFPDAALHGGLPDPMGSVRLPSPSPVSREACRDRCDSKEEGRSSKVSAL